MTYNRLLMVAITAVAMGVAPTTSRADEAAGKAMGSAEWLKANEGEMAKTLAKAPFTRGWWTHDQVTLGQLVGSANSLVRAKLESIDYEEIEETWAHSVVLVSFNWKVLGVAPLAKLPPWTDGPMGTVFPFEPVRVLLALPEAERPAYAAKLAKDNVAVTTRVRVGLKPYGTKTKREWALEDITIGESKFSEAVGRDFANRLGRNPRFFQRYGRDAKAEGQSYMWRQMMFALVIIGLMALLLRWIIRRERREKS